MSWVFATETITTIPIKKGESRDWYEKLSSGQLEPFEILGNHYWPVDFRLSSSEGSYISFRRVEEEVNQRGIGDRAPMVNKTNPASVA